MIIDRIGKGPEEIWREGCLGLDYRKDDSFGIEGMYRPAFINLFSHGENKFLRGVAIYHFDYA